MCRWPWELERPRSSLRKDPLDSPTLPARSSFIQSWRMAASDYSTSCQIKSKTALSSASSSTIPSGAQATRNERVCSRLCRIVGAALKRRIGFPSAISICPSRRVSIPHWCDSEINSSVESYGQMLSASTKQTMKSEVAKSSAWQKSTRRRTV